MCNHCADTLNRRQFIAAVGAAGAALALAACAPDTPAASMYPLPDVYYDHLSESPTAVKIDPSKIVIPPPVSAQKTDYGDIMPRAAWTTSPLQLKNGVLMNGVTRITIHHSGDGKPFLGESHADVIRHLQVVQQGHLLRGMIDIAYHFAIDRTGQAWQLRWLQYEGQHVRNSANGTRNNEHNIGVVCLGDFNLQAVTVAQRDRLLSLAKMLRQRYTPARGAAPAVLMHGEIVSTDCPGKQLVPLIIDARKKGLL